jgi:hypothetical protein
MTVKAENAREEAEIALYKAITEKVGEVTDGTLQNRIAYLKGLADAYAAVAFGNRG